MPTVLMVKSGSDEAMREYPLDRPLSIGRADDNDIRLEDPEVSRHHGMISPDGGGYVFVDLGSANGSVVGKERPDPRVPTPVAPGDVIQIASFALSVRPELLRTGTMIASMPPAPGPSPAPGGTVIAPPEAWLEVKVGSDVRRQPLVGDSIGVGRDPGNAVFVNSDVVSRHHLVLKRSGAGFLAEDLGSTNGFSVNGEATRSHLLKDGDELEIAGEVRLAVHLGQAAVPVPEQQQALDLSTRQVVTIGRDPASDVHLAHPTVSFHHAKITKDPAGTFVVEDLESTNGTFVNGQRLAKGERRTVARGDAIQVGPIRLVVGEQHLRRTEGLRTIGLTAIGLNQKIKSDLNLLQDLSFVIDPQEFVAVVGVSGAGKSTLLGALSGLRPASDGDVLLNQDSLYKNYDAFRSVLGYVPQDDILHKELPVGRALSYTAQLRLPEDTRSEERHQRVDTVITQLGLTERRDTPVGRLSGGQRKRVSIGAELLTEPGLFFLDEATSGLDPGTESQLMRLLRRLADDGHTIVLITHATKNVMLCDQVVFLAKGGYLAYYGPPDQALRYFGVTDFDGIYEKLENESSPAEWAERYLASQQFATYVVRRLQMQGLNVGVPQEQLARNAISQTRSIGLQPPPGGAAAPAANGAVLGPGPGADDVTAPGLPAPSPAAGAAATPAGGRRSSALRQLLILSRRYADILRRDRVGLALLLLVAPVLGAIDLLTWKSNILDYHSGNANRAMSMLFVGALVPFLVGALTFVREIVKESAVYQRERAVSLGIWPYIGSKLVLAFPMALYHAGALLLFKLLAVNFSNSGVSDILTIYGTLVLAVLSGVVWALLISALTSKEEQAMLLVIGVIVVQMVFSGGLVPISDLGPPGVVLSSITSTSWSFKAFTAAAGLNTKGCSGDLASCHLPGIQSLSGVPERQLQLSNINSSFGKVFDANILQCWGAMLAIMVVVIGILFVLQKRKDRL